MAPNATGWPATVSLDPRFEPERPQPTPLADAVAALGAAAASVVRRLGARSSLAWQIIVLITGGRRVLVRADETISRCLRSNETYLRSFETGQA
jgi:hypothetical protein